MNHTITLTAPQLLAVMFIFPAAFLVCHLCGLVAIWIYRGVNLVTTRIRRRSA
jgi:hypothetical protein